jgi:AbrB family looped-hinge helix DNA binding protein
METVKVSKKFQVVIPEKLRTDAKIRPGDKMLVISKHGIIQYIPVRPLEKTKGMAKGADINGIRDELDRM